jgi:hypothetical protein
MHRMPATNPRLTVTLTPAVHAILKELSRITGESQSALIGQVLEQSQPVFERMVQMLQAAELLKAEGLQAKDEIGRSMARAQGRIERQLGLALDDFSEGARPLLEEAERLGRRRGRAVGTRSGTSARPRGRASTPMSNRGVRSPQAKAKKGKKGAA